jgi:spore coat polysaccharide biosynthesis predicted glycosyltransferase SpsG
MAEHVSLSKIAIVTEGGSQIGFGHIYRSINLAEQLRSDAIPLFLTQSDESVASRIRHFGFRTTRCKTNEEILDTLSQIKPTVVVFDEPHLSATLIRSTRAALGETRIIVFDNFFTPAVNRCIDIIVNALTSRDFKNEFINDEDSNTRYYFGPRYLVLKDDFFLDSFEQQTQARYSHKKTVLLTFGGGDYADLTTRALNHILKLNEEMRIQILIGPGYTHLKKLNAVIQANQDYRGHIEVDQDSTNMAERMRDADVIFTSPGLSMFEALRLRKPVIAVYQNELQRADFKNFPLKCIVEQSDMSHMDALLEDVEHFDQDGVDKLQIGEGRTEVLQAIRNLLAPSKYSISNQRTYRVK